MICSVQRAYFNQPSQHGYIFQEVNRRYRSAEICREHCDKKNAVLAYRFVPSAHSEKDCEKNCEQIVKHKQEKHPAYFIAPFNAENECGESERNRKLNTARDHSDNDLYGEHSSDSDFENAVSLDSAVFALVEDRNCNSHTQHH